MSVSAIFITDLKGKVLICRNYRGDVPLSIATVFAKHLQEDEENELRPILTDENEKCTFVYIRHNNVYVMACTLLNVNVMTVLNFLVKFVEVFEDYFNELNEESIRDNFVLTYELFDEMMDFGYPQATEPKILKEYICVQEQHRFIRQEKNNAPAPSITALTGPGIRAENIYYKKNEVFLDVIEKVNLLVGNNGTVIKSEILGAIKLKTFLSGMPELKLGLNDKLLFERMNNNNRSKSTSGAVELEDIRFHHCVSLSRFENDRTISFSPPDGECDLMIYRLNTPVRPLFIVECIVEKHSSTRMEYTIKTRSNFKRTSTARNVQLMIPVPPDADSPTFKANMGKVSYVPEKDCIVWQINAYQGQREFLMRASFGLPTISAEEIGQKNKAPIQVLFEIPYFTVSGLQVRYLKIMEKSGYQALPWVRYVTQNGDYQIRM